MTITIETTNQEFIDDILVIANNRFDFEELGITKDEDKVKHLITSLAKDKVNDLRRSRAISQVQFSDVSNETL